MIKPGDKVGIICCSNGQKRSCMTKIKYLEDTLLKMGIYVLFSDCIYEKKIIMETLKRNVLRH